MSQRKTISTTRLKKSFDTVFRSRLSIVVVGLLLCLPLIRSLFVPGYYGASDDLHIAWLQQIDAVFASGKLPPRYVPDLSYGFGYPLFNFLFPLPFYVGEFIYKLGFNFVESVKIVFGLSIVGSFFAMYWLLRKFTGKLESVVGAVLYTYAPYRATEIYVRGAIGEAFSFIFLPLIILSVFNITPRFRKSNIPWMCALALTSGCLILTHNIVSYMFFPFIALLIVLRISFERRNRISLTLKYAVSLFLALVMSSYFWVPAFLDSRLMKQDTVFNFWDHYPTIRQLITPYWGYGASVPGPYDGMSFFIGYGSLVLLLITLPLVFYFRKKLTKNEKTLVGWGFLSLPFIVFMMNHRSLSFWSHVPLLDYFQFPWRFLTLIAFFVPLFVVVLSHFAYKKVTLFILLIAAVVPGYAYFAPHDFLARHDDYYLDRYIPLPTPSEGYMQTQEEYLRLPASALTRPDMLFPLAWSAHEDLFDYSQENVKALDSVVHFSNDKVTTINISRYNFPGWQLTLDGENVVGHTSPPFGQISLDVNPGKHTLTILFVETPFKKSLDILSLVVFLSALFGIIKYNTRKLF